VQVKTVFRANTSDALLQALESGIGIGGMQRPLAARALRAGRLVPILADWRLPDRFLYAVYPDARFIPPRVRSVIALIEARLPELWGAEGKALPHSEPCAVSCRSPAGGF
jgi:DNA-binding transcriptional LysR family regulator